MLRFGSLPHADFEKIGGLTRPQQTVLLHGQLEVCSWIENAHSFFSDVIDLDFLVVGEWSEPAETLASEAVKLQIVWNANSLLNLDCSDIFDVVKVDRCLGLVGL